MKKNNDVSMIFCTCDAYSDLWDGFFKLFKKYWPEWDGEIIFNTDGLEYSYDGLNIINVPHNEGDSRAWSDMFAKALRLCKNEKYCWYWMISTSWIMWIIRDGFIR